VYDGNNRLTTRELAGTGLATFMYSRSYTANNHYNVVSEYSDLTGTNKVGETDYTWSTSGDLTNVTFKNGTGTVLQQATYTFDSAHRTTAENLNGTNTSYAYDSTNQVTAAGGSNYSFDSSGNRNMAGYTTGTGNQTTNDGTFTYTFDNNGNIATKSKGPGLEKWYYGYDNLNHLTSVRKTSNGTTNVLTVTYSYDALGERVQEDKWVTGGSVVTTKHSYDGQQVLFDLTSGNAVQERYVWGGTPNELLVRQDGSGNTSWIQTDRLGSVIGVTDGTGAQIDSITYDAFGNILSQTSLTTTGNMAWQGMVFDQLTFIAHTGERDDLIPDGKWMQRDPILFQAGDPNYYRLEGNNVTNATDPSGLSTTIAHPTTRPQLLHAIAQAVASGEFKTAVWYITTFSALLGSIYVARPKGLTDEDYAKRILKEAGHPIPTKLLPVLVVDAVLTFEEWLPPWIDHPTDEDFAAYLIYLGGIIVYSTDTPAPGDAGHAPGGNAGNLRQINPAREGIDAHALKPDFVGNQAGQFNIAVDANGQVVLVPVRAGTHPNVPTGLTLEQAAQLYPK
jgi:RHS repeat-associated protein